MDHQQGIFGAAGALQQHSNVTQNQSLTPLVERLMRATVAIDNVKPVPAKKNVATSSPTTISSFFFYTGRTTIFSLQKSGGSIILLLSLLTPVQQDRPKF